MHKLIDYICDELDELERKAEKEGKLTMAEVEYGDVLAHFKKNLLTADAMMDDGNYSGRDGRSYRRGRSYRDGRMYGRNYRRDDRGRYYGSAEDEVMESLEKMLNETDDEKTRTEIHKFMSKLEQMH